MWVCSLRRVCVLAGTEHGQETRTSGSCNFYTCPWYDCWPGSWTRSSILPKLTQKRWMKNMIFEGVPLLCQFVQYFLHRYNWTCLQLEEHETIQKIFQGKCTTVLYSWRSVRSGLAWIWWIEVAIGIQDSHVLCCPVMIWLSVLTHELRKGCRCITSQGILAAMLNIIMMSVRCITSAKL